jgi:hypothetical protein
MPNLINKTNLKYFINGVGQKVRVQAGTYEAVLPILTQVLEKHLNSVRRYLNVTNTRLTRPKLLTLGMILAAIPRIGYMSNMPVEYYSKVSKKAVTDLVRRVLKMGTRVQAVDKLRNLAAWYLDSLLQRAKQLMLDLTNLKTLQPKFLKSLVKMCTNKTVEAAPVKRKKRRIIMEEEEEDEGGELQSILDDVMEAAPPLGKKKVGRSEKRKADDAANEEIQRLLKIKERLSDLWKVGLGPKRKSKYNQIAPNGFMIILNTLRQAQAARLISERQKSRRSPEEKKKLRLAPVFAGAEAKVWTPSKNERKKLLESQVEKDMLEYEKIQRKLIDGEVDILPYFRKNPPDPKKRNKKWADSIKSLLGLRHFLLKNKQKLKPFPKYRNPRRRSRKAQPRGKPRGRSPARQPRGKPRGRSPARQPRGKPRGRNPRGKSRARSPTLPPRRQSSPVRQGRPRSPERRSRKRR